MKDFWFLYVKAQERRPQMRSNQKHIESLVDLLYAISVISKRMANELYEQIN